MEKDNRSNFSKVLCMFCENLSVLNGNKKINK
jgi:ribosomal protein S27E